MKTNLLPISLVGRSGEFIDINYLKQAVNLLLYAYPQVSPNRT